MKLHEQIEGISTNKDLADFIEKLRADLLTNPNDWENPTLERFLEAMEEWVRSMEHFYKNTGREMPPQPNWKMVADMLYAAKIYE